MVDMSGLVQVASGVIGGAVGGALVTGLIARFIVKPYEAQTTEKLTLLGSNLENERDERRALRDRVDTQEKTRFDLLHEQRAQVMRETFSALCDLEDALDDFSRSYGGFVGGPGPMEYWKKMQSAAISFRKAFSPNRILFDAPLASDLSELNRTYVEIGNKFYALVGGQMTMLTQAQRTEEAQRNAEYDALQQMLTREWYGVAIQRIPPLISRVAAAFRELYGSEPSS